MRRSLRARTRRVAVAAEVMVPIDTPDDPICKQNQYRAMQLRYLVKEPIRRRPASRCSQALATSPQALGACPLPAARHT